MVVTVHQPQYLPWLGYFDKMRRADVFCYLNDVQYKKNEWQNRNRIKTAQDWQWITVPVCYHFPEKIHEVHINNGVDWTRKHPQALITNYRRVPYYRVYIPIFEDFYSKEWEFKSELNVHLIERLEVYKTWRTKHMNLILLNKFLRGILPKIAIRIFKFMFLYI